MNISVKKNKDWLIAAFIATTLAFLTACLLVLSYRMHGTLVDLSEKTDRAIQIADKIHMTFSREIAAIVGFQTTGEDHYAQLYQDATQTINPSLGELERLSPLLGDEVRSHLKELKSAINAWHQDPKTQMLARQRLPPGKFRQLVFDRMSALRHAQESTTEFNASVVAYESTQRLRLERLGSLFRTLAVIFGPLAVVAIVLIAYILRRLNAMSSHLEDRANDEEALRQVGVSLTGGIGLDDVLRRITEATATAAQCEGVFIETANNRKPEVTCVAAYGVIAPATGTKSPLEGSILEEVLKTEQPKIIENVDIESYRSSPIGELARSGQTCTAMVVPLIAENERLGAMFLIRPRRHRFTDAEFPKVRILADMASIALLRAVRVEKIEKMEAQANFLADISKLLASSLDYTTTLKRVVRLAVPLFADWGIVYLIERGRIYIADLVHADPQRNPILERLRSKAGRPEYSSNVENVIQTGQAKLIPEVTDELIRENSVDNEQYELLLQLNFKSAMLVPLIFGQETLGAMTFIASDPRSYASEDLGLAEEIGRHAAIAIHNAQLYMNAQHAIQARDEVFHMVSHDLRNPISNIEMAANLLASGSLPDENRPRMLQMISRASLRMHRLIEDLITIGRMEQGRGIPLELEQVDPAGIADEVYAAVAVQARAKRIDFQCKKEPAIPAIKADRRRIVQVLTNLSDNAIKFTREGGSITLSYAARDREVQFAVEDTGPGINPKDLDKIFNPFWQAKPGHTGSGLGLALAKAIVDEHRGKIWAQSKPDVGTTVFFTIPRADIGEMSERPAA